MLATILSAFARRRAPEPRVGPYTLVRKLGEGAMGVVYEARHERLRRRAAIKVLPKEKAGGDAPARFEREAQATARLSHPNIVPLYDFGRTADGTLYYAMEYLDGVDLERLVAAHGPQPASRVADLLLQAAEALAELHAAGLVHRDVKPANLVLSHGEGRRDVLKIVDLGLVQDLAGGARSSGRPAGTPLYMAPEAIATPEAVDARADLYSLGAVGYFLIAGTPPFTGEAAIDVLAQHLQAEPEPPSRHAAVPEDLERLILACLAKRPEDRPASAAALVKALSAR
jgi:serine/threonine protein kinase